MNNAILMHKPLFTITNQLVSAVRTRRHNDLIRHVIESVLEYTPLEDVVESSAFAIMFDEACTVDNFDLVKYLSLFNVHDEIVYMGLRSAVEQGHSRIEKFLVSTFKLRYYEEDRSDE